MSQKTRALLALAGGVLCIGFAPIFTKLADVTGDIAGVYRLGISSLILIIPMIIHWRNGHVQLPRFMWGPVLIAGLLFGFNLFAINTAIHLSNASTAVLIGNNAPIVVGLGAWLIFKERLTYLYLVGLVVALLGTALVVSADGVTFGSLAMRGNLWAAINVTGYGAFQLMNQRNRKHTDNFTYLVSFTVLGSVTLLAISLATGSQITGLPPESVKALLWLVGIHLVGWFLLSYAYGHLPTRIISVSLLGQPVVTALFARPVLGETPTYMHLLGGIVALTGIYLVQRSNVSPDE